MSTASTQAEEAARAAAVTIRGLTDPKEYLAVADLFTRIWALEPGQTPMPSALMRVMAYEGCYVAGVFDDENGGRLIGAATAFLAADDNPDAIHLHSHIAGLLPEANGRHAGFALKLHQRAWALSRGLRRITWTFDPLVRGNAYFNLAKLGAQASTYLVDFYGDMPDGVNVGQGSDRILMDWRLDAPRVVAAASGVRAEAPEVDALLREGRVLLSAEEIERVEHAGSLLDTPGSVLCPTPAAIQTLRREDPDQARRWRFAVRAALTEALASGYRVTGFTRSGWYLLDPAEGAPNQ